MSEASSGFEANNELTVSLAVSADAPEPISQENEASTYSRCEISSDQIK
jgi:hypothetical protein